MVVFMLIVVMVGVSAGILATMQQELQVAGQDREQVIALYAAEHGVAMAQAALAAQTFDTTTGWTSVLTLAAMTDQMCQPVGGTKPGVLPKNTNPRQGLQVLPADATQFVSQYVWCIHNNQEDPAYLAPTGGTPNGDTTDAQDTKHIIVIESYGYGPNSAATHLTVSLGAPTLVTRLGSNAYAQEGANAAHSGAVGQSEQGVTVSGGSTSF